eukprot:gnl/Chilomastix_caulleri/2319.p1 GENE.gnl/Chilomastix_caulleri/2319~~gnl/Chilomastix_caulleri/2319.p1  ORF type:complete len:76 (+),score=30.26 gnl/Chilomastix_caulleri/2319:69-296(+)
MMDNGWMIKREGSGRFTDPSGVTYIGEWKDGRKHGQGVVILPTGESFKGIWEDGEIVGMGVFSFGKDSLWNDPDY